MCGGSNDDAVEQATQAEQEHQAQVAAAIAQINALFASPGREAQYADYTGARRQLYSDEVNRQNTDATRNNKFALARAGQIGGSLNRDVGERQGKTYQRALVDAERLAQGDEASLRGQDQQSRLSLIQMAQAGLDATTGVQNAATALQNNLLTSQTGQGVRALGDVFKDYTEFYRKSKDEKARREGEKYTYNTLYSPSIYSGYATQ